MSARVYQLPVRPAPAELLEAPGADGQEGVVVPESRLAGARLDRRYAEIIQLEAVRSGIGEMVLRLDREPLYLESEFRDGYDLQLVSGPERLYAAGRDGYVDFQAGMKEVFLLPEDETRRRHVAAFLYGMFASAKAEAAAIINESERRKALAGRLILPYLSAGLDIKRASDALTTQFAASLTVLFSGIAMDPHRVKHLHMLMRHGAFPPGNSQVTQAFRRPFDRSVLTGLADIEIPQVGSKS